MKTLNTLHFRIINRSFNLFVYTKRPQQQPFHFAVLYQLVNITNTLQQS